MDRVNSISISQKASILTLNLYHFLTSNSYPQSALIHVKMVIFDSLSIN